MGTAMFRSIGKFAANTRGAFAMQFALLAIPLTVCTGLAIDGGRAFLARFELASALDAAALAVGSTLQNDADLDAIAAKFVNSNFRTEHATPIELELVPGAEDSLTLKGNVTISTFFMPIIGQPYVTVAAESEVRHGGSNVEVALVLDITGSMNATRMAGLTSAAKILIDKVVNTVQTPFFSKIAITPWSQSVYLGSTHVNAGVVEELRGTLTGSTSISAAGWRNGSTTTKTISEAGWRTTAGAKTIANAGANGAGGIDWRWGPSRNITGFAKVTSSTRIQVTTSANHGYSNGEFVRFTGITTGSYTALNNNIYRVADKTNTTFNLRNIADTAYITPPAGSTSSTGASQRCHDSACNVGITTTSAFTGLAAGDFVNITGTSGFPGTQTPNAINNSATTTWVVANVPSTTRFTLANWNGPNFGATMNSGGGTVSECLVSDCRYRVTTSAAHSFAATDYVYIWGMTETGSGTNGNSDANTTWSVSSPSGSVFYLPGNGKNYKDWSSGGSAAECALATCNVQITSASHGLAVDARVEIKGATGLTGINTCALSSSGQCSSGSNLVWRISAVAGNVLTLADTSPALSNMSGAYGSGGTLQCTTYGCNRLWFTNGSGSERVYRPSECLVERYGENAYTDVDPADAPLGILYTGDGTCITDNYATPLTADKARLNTAIDDLQTGGSTAGQLGMAWGWYMLSPNFASIWDKEAVNQPMPYATPLLAKVVVLMTDGEFNFATCSGVSSGTINSSICVPDDAGDTTASKHAAFKQAEAFCTAMKEQNIIIYTVGLELNTALYSDDFLLGCASSPEHAFLANDNAELEDAFKDIATSISRLRISK